MMFIVLIYRLGNAVTVPYIDGNVLSSFFSARSDTIFGLLNTMSGSALERASIFALGIQPYINASIILQLLTIAIPALERMQKDGGEDGKRKIEKITRYATVAIAVLQGYAFYVLITQGFGGQSILDPSTAGDRWVPLVIIGTFMAGSVLLMWMGEQITEFGIGNGISIILFVSIVARFPASVGQTLRDLVNVETRGNWWIYLLMLVGALAILVLIVIVNSSERRIPIQYPKQTRGRRMYGGQSTHLPIKVNMSGVLPIIFAQSMAGIVPTIAAFVPAWSHPEHWTQRFFGPTSWVYIIVYFLLIVFFSYFYSTVQMNPVEISNNLRKNGALIPGIRTGRPTSDFISRVLRKVTMFGALYLAIIAIGPLIVGYFSETARVSGIQMGGTSVIIVVSVALETIKQLEAQMVMRHYKGFLE